MDRIRIPAFRRLFWLLEPMAAVVFLVLWITAEVGRRPMGLATFVLLAIAIALTRLAPWAALGCVAALLVGQALTVFDRPTSTNWPAYLGILIAVGLVARSHTGRVRWAALGVGSLGAGLAGALMGLFRDGWGSWTGMPDSGSARNRLAVAGTLICVGLVLGAMAWACGSAVRLAIGLAATERLRAASEAKLAVSEVDLTVSRERNRIAQEIHDILGHTLAVIIAQADGARYVPGPRTREVDSALEAIAGSSRAALADLGGIVDAMLDGSTPPQPSITELPALLEGAARAGLDATLTHAGDGTDGVSRLSAGQQLAAFRILQESVTNALRHRGRGSALRVVLDWRGPGLALQILSSGAGSRGDERPAGAGRGVEGMRERARLAGGWLVAGLDDDGAYRIAGYLPYGSPPEAFAGTLTEVPSLTVSR